MTQRALLALLAGALLAPSLAAETFTVKLSSGATLELRYPLEEAPWDKDTLLYLSEGGNWTAIPRADVLEVRSAVEFKGQGVLIDSTTIFMGLAANDMPLPEDEKAASSTDRLFDILQKGLNRSPVTTEQFVEPGDAGGSGLPVDLTQPYSPQTGVPSIVPLGPGITGGGGTTPIVSDGGSQ